MIKDSIYKPIDHFLQAEIIAKLAAANDPVRFRDLKEPGIENSLFMYYANKLIARGLIEKSEAGFRLTLKGARWTNYVNALYDLTPVTPRPLVQFIIKDSAANTLIATRKGSLKQLNDHLFPGNVYCHGLTLEENTAAIYKEIFDHENIPPADLLTIADVIHYANDGFVSHVICYIFRVQVAAEKPTPLDHPLFTTQWVATETILPANPIYARSQFIPLLLERLPHISPHEVFRIKI